MIILNREIWNNLIRKYLTKVLITRHWFCSLLLYLVVIINKNTHVSTQHMYFFSNCVSSWHGTQVVSSFETCFVINPSTICNNIYREREIGELSYSKNNFKDLFYILNYFLLKALNWFVLYNYFYNEVDSWILVCPCRLSNVIT